MKDESRYVSGNQGHYFSYLYYVYHLIFNYSHSINNRVTSRVFRDYQLYYAYHLKKFG